LMRVSSNGQPDCSRTPSAAATAAGTSAAGPPAPPAPPVEPLPCTSA
jgi:hypothetical protein